MPNFKRASSFLIFAVVLFVTATSHAGGPFVVDTVNDTGVAQRWQNDTFEWYSETGRFSSSVNNATGISWITEALDKWANVTLDNRTGGAYSTSVLSVRSDPKGSVGVDINLSNIADFYIDNDEMRTTVVFDDNGDITAAILPQVQNARNGILGLTQPLLTDSTGLHITKGISILNGTMLANSELAYNPQEFAKAVIVHELGHLLNLDHSQVNQDIAETCTRTTNTCTGGSGNYIPTMHPELLNTGQGVLANDDIITISWIYPSADFEQNFCTITGLVYDAGNNYLKGVNVIAKRAEGTTAPYVDARSFVSGALKEDCVGDSRYYLRGIVPGLRYQVIYEPIDTEFTGASGFEPLDNPPTGFDGGTISSTSGATTVSCSAGGETIEMASVTINVTNPCGSTGSGGSEGGGSTESATSSSSKCSLYPISAGSCFALGYLLAALAGVVIVKLYEARSRKQEA